MVDVVQAVNQIVIVLIKGKKNDKLCMVDERNRTRMGRLVNWKMDIAKWKIDVALIQEVCTALKCRKEQWTDVCLLDGLSLNIHTVGCKIQTGWGAIHPSNS